MPHEYRTSVSQLREALTQQRYNPVVVHNYCQNAEQFLSYLAERGIALEAVTPTEVSNYLRLAVRRFRKRHSRTPARYWVSIPRAGIHSLLTLALKRWPPEPATSDAGELLCRQIFCEYQTWLREERGLAETRFFGSKQRRCVNGNAHAATPLRVRFGGVRFTTARPGAAGCA